MTLDRAWDARLEALAVGAGDRTCPSPDEIVRYVLGILPPGRQSTLADHVAACPDCRVEVDALRGALDAVIEDEDLEPARDR